MALKSTRLARAENLTPEQQVSIGRTEGLVVMEVWNPELREAIKPIGDGGITEYLTQLGEFNEDSGVD